MAEQREKGYNTKEDWNKNGLRNWQDYKWLYSNLVKHYTSPEPLDKMLDIGCGRADFMDTCQHFGLPASRIFGIEGDPDSYAICVEKGYAISKIDLDTDKLPFPDNHFSFVVCSQLLEHITREAGVSLMKEIHRVLKKEGLLLIYSPSYFNKAGRNMPFHLYCWKPYELRDLMKEIGYKGITTKISAMQWYDLISYNDTWHQKILKKKPNPLELLLKYIVYGLFLLTKNQRLLSQTAFAAYK